MRSFQLKLNDFQKKPPKKMTLHLLTNSNIVLSVKIFDSFTRIGSAGMINISSFHNSSILLICSLMITFSAAWPEEVANPPPSDGRLKIVAFSEWDAKGKSDRTHSPKSMTSLHLNKEYILTVDDFSTLENKTKGKSLFLLLNGIPVNGIDTEILPERGVRLKVNYNAENKTHWNDLYKNADKRHETKVLLSLGGQTEDGKILPVTDAIDLKIEFLPRYADVWPWFFSLLTALAVIFWLSLKSGLLRDSISSAQNVTEKTFSLGKAQMIYWILVIGISEFWLVLLTGSPVLNTQLLVLAGIAASTTAASGIINRNQQAAQSILEQKAGKMKREITDVIGSVVRLLQNNLSNSEFQTANISKVLSKLNELDGKIKIPVPDALPGHSEGIFIDLLTDATGVSLTRFQNFLFTGSLGIYFVYTVYTTLNIPEFDDSTLVLMGISSGGYLTLKLSEKHS